MIKRLFATVSVAMFALAIGIFAFSATQVEAQDLSGHSLVLGFAEYITDPTSGEAGGMVIYNDAVREVLQRDSGNGQLTHDFVYNDPRAAWDTVPGISFGVKYGNTTSDQYVSNQSFWMVESLRMWERINCSALTLTEVPVSSAIPGLVENYFAGGGLDIGLIQSDITQVGFRGPSAIFPPGTNTLGVAYTLFWTDAQGNLTDIDNNGKIDAALREIYYNDQYEWADDGIRGERGSGYIDFPAVAIHEAGHGLSAAHFGTISINNQGELVTSPTVIMNAIYSGIQRDLHGRDRGSHCSNWAQWPN